MADSLKVDKKEFEEVIRALLNTKPLPAAEIPKKREAKANPTKKQAK